MFMIIAYPIILVVGLIGNFTNFYVFTRRRLKGLSTFRVLAYLSLVDALYIFIGISHIIIIIFFDHNFRNDSNLACSVHSFLTIYLSHLSSKLKNKDSFKKSRFDYVYYSEKVIYRQLLV